MPMVLLNLVQAGLVVVLVLGAGMSPSSAAVLAVGLVAGTAYVVNSDTARLFALTQRTLGLPGR
jgi:hypothetical protein